MIKILTYTICLAILLVSTAAHSYMVPYIGKRTYKLPFKDLPEEKIGDSRYGGFTTYVKSNNRLIDADFRYTVNDNFSTAEKSSRYDLTGVYSKYGNGTSWRIGGHYIKERDSTLDEGLTLLAGIKWYKARSSEFGATVFHSTYSDFFPKKLSVWQLTPFFQFFTSGHGKERSFSLQLDLNLTAAPDWASGPDSHDHFYYSSGLNVTYYHKYFNIGAYMWAGKRIYHISYDAMDVTNHLFLERAGYSVFARYRVLPKIWLKFSGEKKFMRTLNASSKFSYSDYIFSVQIHH